MVNSKAKGSQFEREVCVKLSLWLTKGQNKDVLWRTAMSGGRATVGRGKVRQCGDICSVAEEGHVLTNNYFIECKHVRDLQFDMFILHDKGYLARYWMTARTQARKYGLQPLLIAKANRFPIVVLTMPSARLNRFPVANVRGSNIGLFDRLLLERIDEFRAFHEERPVVRTVVRKDLRLQIAAASAAEEA